jgi:hypothetical protein
MDDDVDDDNIVQCRLSSVGALLMYVVYIVEYKHVEQWEHVIYTHLIRW